MQSADDPQPRDSVGSILAAARRDRGLTVSQVSERTRVRAGLIDQIERDDFSQCGGTVYARGHLRSIATTLGLDPGRVLAAYDASHEHHTGPLVIIPSAEFDPLRGGSRRRRGGFRWGPAMIVSLVVVCVIAALALLLPGSSGSSDDRAAPGPGGAVGLTPTVSVPPVSTSPAAPSVTTPAPTGVNVVLTVRDAQSWLEVRDDAEHVLLSQLLQSGDSRTVTASGALHIRVGNAGAVDVSCNGRSLGAPGGLGQVVTIRVSAAASGACEVGDEQRSGLVAAPPPAPVPVA
ncbi:helix-turn-helix domain-containing protein [Frankia sp. BMG5.23]|uniref:helix-turn-helix domain-containing protein n=1 Tax=Frankia sp. BMG5.23 TaxID=683305 RepID=UPI000460E6BB|nr:helix-turn-helix domain-containing protein [Frankia sp. BMG5.23]KDA43679.1 hypothetical protein BMG523Draft_01339 [Frankia sp. BMG5.23]